METEKLFKEYRSWKKDMGLLEFEISRFRGVPYEDVIRSMCLSQSQGERVQGGGTSDKTGNAAVKYRQVKERLDDDWFDYLLGRYQAVKEELEFFEYAVGQLSGRLPEVVRDMVMEDMTWRALSEKYSVSEAMIGMVPLKVSVSGNGRQQWLPARIVGFSSRLNTIAVPEQFMEWANERFAEEPVSPPSRLIIEVSRPGDPAIKEFLQSHGYESAGDKADNGKAAYFLSVVTAVVIVVGAIISLLSFFILMLSIYLLLQKNRTKLHDLMLLGYSPGMVSSRYCRMVVAINIVVLVAAIAVVLVGRHLWGGALSSLGLSSTSPWPAIVTGLAIMLLITVVNIISIRRTMMRYFKG